MTIYLRIIYLRSTLINYWFKVFNIPHPRLLLIHIFTNISNQSAMANCNPIDHLTVL